MPETDWGRKHVCMQCQVPFYDMRRAPIICPKCGATHQPVALLKSDGRPPRRNRLRPALVTTGPGEPEEEAPSDSAEPAESDVDAGDVAKAVDAESGR